LFILDISLHQREREILSGELRSLISLLVLHVVDVDSHHVVRVVLGLPGTLGRRHPVPVISHQLPLTLPPGPQLVRLHVEALEDHVRLQAVRCGAPWEVARPHHRVEGGRGRPDILHVVVLIVHQFLAHALIQETEGALQAAVQIISKRPRVEIMTEGGTLGLDISWTSAREMPSLYKLGIVHHPETAEVIFVTYETLVK